MSVKVDLDKLGQTLADFPLGYLITVGDDFRAHTVAVTPIFEGGAFTIGPVGKTTARNAAAHDAVTVLWPPREPTGYSLIVDGTAELTDGGVRLTPSRAVLHRSAIEPGAGTDPAGLHDCLPLKG
ncbi:pyridoxamine 5'-phosphate oxidase family protein [Mycobacterium frederiksbergense]|uniref:Pyridoxamine 5'-phosphate oxidase family protein n=1 Tax=Mycolicibacterium frederiksbergense TaxID=117567 RepID=A0A6H0S5Q1_9MYCO|nr:pyridoxamine 5'-phosphate oxidase family protein [Mycolicibacterium frederiksbergense]MBX9920474.1 pyridoxamine 5'-phosphate oxidase family protein [Mycolicibacterium frederiksbergense]MCV7043625.1 pyridoxamine 5'-phosphate oxidase family protein [Mycolicibacterium frederiksbergense]MDO0973099.1 pyridoxamine 5'-phosphate oxidase family protein [Mycolicibacterium frederiksbergense]QIV81367.1 pyridoxamine 5'-phosphate oxidase family protein [Mycolicibacterium frederiksbergense]